MKKPIKVMHIIARMNLGGPAFLVHDILKGLNMSDFSQILVTGYCEENEVEFLGNLDSGFIVERIAGFSRSVSLWNDAKAIYSIFKVIRKYHPDVIHTHTTKAGLLGRAVAVFFFPSMKLIHTFHGHIFKGYFSHWKSYLIVLMERILAKFTYVLVAIGSEVKRDLLSHRVGTESKVRVVFPGLSPIRLVSKEAARSQIAISQSSVSLLYLGRLEPIKRPDRLLKIARHLKVRNENAEILVVGEGELFEETKASAASENLPMRFYGWRRDIELFLSASDIGILCSDNEGVPLTLIQYSLAGLPIISTNVGSVGDIVIDNVNGFLTSSDMGDYCQRLDSLIEDNWSRKKLGKNGIRLANKNFSLEKMINSHSNLYAEASQT